MHISILSRTRKRNAENGRKTLKLGVTNGYGTYNTREKYKFLLDGYLDLPCPGNGKQAWVS